VLFFYLQIIDHCCLRPVFPFDSFSQYPLTFPVTCVFPASAYLS